MYSFYGGKQGRTYNIVQRYDEIFFDKDNEELYPPHESETTQYHLVGDKFNYENEIYLVLPFENNDPGGDIEMPADIGTKVIQLHGMVNEFMKGGSYTDVNYGQYVIIDTILNLDHKNDDTNGILYRRGLDYTEAPLVDARPSRVERQDREFQYSVDTDIRFVTLNVFKFHDYELDVTKSYQENPPTIDDFNDLGFNTAKWTSTWRSYVISPGGGAIYIGQIVGPLGNSPQLYLYNWQTFLENTSTGATYSPAAMPINMGRYPGVIYEEDEQEISYSKGASTRGISTTFNDEIQAGYYNLVDIDGNYYAAAFSFKFPYTVFKIEGISISPYGEQTLYHTNLENITDIYSIDSYYDSDSGTRYYQNLIHQHSNGGYDHPYYRDWQIAIPKGIKGDSVAKIEISPPATIAQGATPRSIMATVVNYDQKQEGDTFSGTIGYLDEIDHLTLDQDYNLSAHYTTGSSQNLGQINTIKSLNYIPGTSSSLSTGSSVIATYMNGDTAMVGQIETVTDISRIGDNLIATYSSGSTKEMTTFGSTPRVVTFAPTTSSTGTTYYSYQQLIQDYTNGFGAGTTASQREYDKPQYKGQVAVIVSMEQGKEVATLYAYNYSSPRGWVQIYKYSLEQDASSFVAIADEHDSPSTYHVNTNGIIFITFDGHSHYDSQPNYVFNTSPGESDTITNA